MFDTSKESKSTGIKHNGRNCSTCSNVRKSVTIIAQAAENIFEKKKKKKKNLLKYFFKTHLNIFMLTVEKETLGTVAVNNAYGRINDSPCVSV